MSERFEIDDGFIEEQNRKLRTSLDTDYEHLAEKLRRKNINIEDLKARAQAFTVAVPSWGVGTGGTRFARFAGSGEPRNIYEKLEDCGVIHQLTQSTPTVSLHFPWDKVSDAGELLGKGQSLGLGFDAVNSNTFSDA